MLKFLRRWFPQIPLLPRVDFCSSCWRRYEESKPWVETWKDLKFCRACLLAMNGQLQANAIVHDPTRLVLSPHSDNPYQAPQAVDSDAACAICGLVPTAKSAVLYNKLLVCERCIRVSLQLLDDAENPERVQL